MERKGFSLLEILVVITIITITVIALGYSLTYAIKYSKLNNLREQALYKADKVANYLSALNFNDACLQPGITYNCGSDTLGCCNGYSGDDSITYSVEGIDPDVKKIIVEVKFQSMKTLGKVRLERLKGNW